MNLASLDLPLIEARCDWITCSSKHTTDGAELMHYAIAMCEQERASGAKMEAYHMAGYSGFQTRHVRTGWGINGAIAVFSGELATICCDRAATLADHWSRVDYCVTVRSNEISINPPEEYYAIKSKLSDRPNGHPAMSQFRELWGGNTFYVGKRISPYYCRCYDKSEESKGDYPPGCWRWEVELKRHASEAAHVRARQSGLTPAYVKAFVADSFQRWGLMVPWRPDDEVKRDPQIRHRLDAERKMAWMETSIRPSIDFVREALGTHRVLRALGLPSIRYESDPSSSIEESSL